MKTATRKLCCLGTVLTAATVVVLTSVLPGCNGQPPIVESAADGTAAEFDCSDKLDSALEMLRPIRLGISTDAESAELRLNSWLKDCGQGIDAGEAPGPNIRQMLQPVLSQRQMNRLTTGRFVSGDAEHIRNCQLHNAMAKRDLGSQKNELEQVVELFHFCVRNIALHASEDERLPLTPYEILLFGRGDPQDVAWVYADVLRQLQIDVVIIRPAMTDADSTVEDNTADDLWLIGVLLNEQVYLFDPRVGTPIPAAADTGKTPTVRQPATLSDVLKDDSLLRKLDDDNRQRYPFTAETLRRVTVEVVGTRSLWTAPMQRLDASLSGDRSILVFDGLQDDADSPGLISRVAEYGGENWGRDGVSIWPYPEQQAEAARHRGEDLRKRLSNLELPLDAPVFVEFNTAAQQFHIITYDPNEPENLNNRRYVKYIKTRISHMLGDYDTAIRSYQKMRMRLVIVSRQPQPAEIRAMNARAEDDAAYWVGLCQFDKGNLKPAISTFDDYVRRFKQKPDAAWIVHCRLMLALSHAETPDWIEALYVLEDELTDEETPEPLAARRRFWIKRWKAAQNMAE